jgi:site-specific DNA-cytosine methylase
VVAAGNTFERDGSTCRSRPLSDPPWAIHTTPAFGLAFQIEAMPGMNNGGWDGDRYRPTDRPAPTVTTTQAPALVTHRGAVIPFRRHTHPTDLGGPAPTQTAQQIPGLAIWRELGAMFAKNNGNGADTVYHATADPFGTVTAADTTSLVTWIDNYRSGPHPVDEPAGTITCIERQALANTDGTPVDVDDVRFRMLSVMEIRRVMAYPDDFRFAGPDDTEPSNRDKVRLLGDGVTPPVLTWLTSRTLRVLDEASADETASNRGRPRGPLTAMPSPSPRSGPSRRSS